MFDQTLKILFNEKINSDIFLLGFESPGIALEAKPGQFVMIRISDTYDPLLRRPFSICGIRDKNTVLILYRVLGKGTSLLSFKKKGDTVAVMGPLGRGFTLPEKDSTIILVAGGMGIAPLYFLAGELDNPSTEFMAGFKSSQEIVMPEQIDVFDICVSLATNDGSIGYKGLVTNLFEKYLLSHSGSRDSLMVFSCGPSQMLKKTASIAAEYNIRCQVSLETHMACGLGACQGCAVKTLESGAHSPYRHVCQDGPVFSSADIDWDIL
ncbi:MAG: dihydroorotate dehydrogenase electron transfer subunit [Deltaproteobacteria bacterium]|nr:dihydroorotate dehydrogenase electron transfer subunit [Deltaproteobacteria bacterium]